MLTFSEPVYASNTATAFTDSTVDDVITLKKTGADGDAIAFDATVTTTGANANKVVTINPSSDLEEGVVYVAVSNAFYDAQGNQGAATNASFTIDTTAPTISSASVNSTVLTVTFSENLDTSKKADESAFRVVVLGLGTNPVSSYTLSGKTATLILRDVVGRRQSLTLAYRQPEGSATKIVDVAGNALASTLPRSEVSVTNNDDKTAPTVTFSPANGARSNAKSADIVLTFSEPVYADTSATAFTESAVVGIITLNKTGVSGTAIPFAATVTTSGANANKVVTIDHSGDLDDGVVYVAVSNDYYDAQGNRGAATSASFTIDTAPPTLASAIVVGTTLVATFSENLDTAKKAAESAFTVDVSGTNSDPTVSSYSLSGKTATLTLSKAVKQGESLTLTYTQPSGNATKIADVAGNALASIPSGSEVSVTNNTDDTDTTAPTVTFSPANGARSNAKSADIVLTFSEPVYANDTITAFTDDTVDDVITLKKTGADGDAIAFAVSVTTSGANANKVVTINPTNDLEDGVVYVAVSNAFYDAQGNQGAATNVSFTIDATPPTISSASVNGNTLTATFSENLDTSKKAAESAFTVDVAGTNSDPTVSSYTLSGTTATMTLSKAVKQGETVKLSYTQPTGAAAKIADVTGNVMASIPSGSEVSVTNNTDTTAPTVTFSPANGARSNAKSADIVLTFSEPVYASNTATAFTDSTVDDVITLKKTGADGDAIAFDATVTTTGANANKVVTINPSNDLEEGVVYVAVSNTFYDARGNQGAATNASFTIDTTPPTISSASVNGNTLTATFSENLDTSKKAAESAFRVIVVGTGHNPVSSYTLSGKTATMILRDVVRRGDSLTLTYTQPIGNAPKIVDVAGNALASIPSGSEVSVTNNDDDTAPTVAFSPADGARTNANGTDIVLTFSESVYADADATAFTSDTVDDIITLTEYHANGHAIPFAVTVTTSGANTNKVVTIDPSSGLFDGVVYVAVSNAYYDAQGNQGAATNATFTIDTAPPRLASATVSGATLTATFSEDLDTSKKAAESAFTVDVSGTNSDPTVSSYSLSGKTATMTLSKAVKEGETVTLRYTQPAGKATKIVDVAGNALASIPSGSAVSVTNNTDNTAPTLASATVIGTTLTATFSEDLDTSKKAVESAFTVDVSGTNSDPTVSSYSLSGKTATMTLSKAVKQGETVKLSYTQPAGNATKIADLAGNVMASIPSGSEVSVTNNTDNTAPTVAFAPANGARSNAKSADIVLTFSEPVYASNTATAFTDSTVDDVITLKKTGVGGDAIAFDATVTTSGANANKVVTINPSSDLVEGVVYVAVSNAFYDAQGNQGAATNATFTVDATAPTISSASVNGTVLTVTFSENLDTAKKAAVGDFMVAVVGVGHNPVSSYTLSGKTATLILRDVVRRGQSLTLTYTQPIGNVPKIVDVAGNALASIPSGSAVSVTNNDDDTAPTVAFSPADGARSNARGTAIVLTFSEPVYMDDDATAFTSDLMDDIITLKKTGADGDAIDFAVTVTTGGANANKVVTINPSSDLEEGVVYVAVSNAFYDAQGNQGAATSVTFTIDTAPPTLASATVIGSTLTATFSEDLDTAKKAAGSAFTVDVSGTNSDPTVSSYTLSGKTATMTLSKAVKQGESLTLSYTQPAGKATKIVDVAGNALASIPSGSAVSVTNNTDDTAPTVAFKLGEVALTGTVLSTDADGNIILTFSEPVYADASATAFTADTVDDVITLTEDDADGDAIAFAVTVTTSGANANKVVTVNPSSNLADGVVYVAVSNAFYDAQGNQGAATNTTFTIDTTAPTLASATVIGNTLTATFSENLDTSKKAAESAFTVDVSGSNSDPTVSSYTLAGKTATMTLSKAVKPGETVKLGYTQPAGNAAKIADPAGNVMASIPSGSEVSVTNNTTAPTVAFKLGDVALTGTVVSNDDAGNIVLTFSEPVYANNTATAFTADTVDDIITLNKTGVGGTAIPFTVTVTTSGANANKVVTVNPSSNLDDGVVYVAVSNAFYDAWGNQGAATNASFTIDTTAPTLASATVAGATLTATFSENLDTSKKAAESAFTVDVAGTAADPTVSSYTLSGKTATMILSHVVRRGQSLTLTYTQPAGNVAKIADVAGNVMASIPSGSEVSVTNNDDNTAPTVAFAPANGARSNAKSADIVLTFSEPVYANNTATTAFTSDTVDDIITLKKTGVGGDDIAFAVTVTTSGANTNKVVTINPSSDLEEGVVYVAVSNAFYDAQGNQGAATNASFTIDTTAPTLASATVDGDTLTATFSENLDTSKKAAKSAFTVDVAGTNADPTVSAYTLSGKTATLTLSKAVKQGETLTLTYTQPKGNATKIADLAGNALASFPSDSEVSVTNNTDTTAPTVAFKLGDVALTGTVVSNDDAGNIVLTFSEPVYANNTATTAFTSDTVDDIITLKKTGADGDAIGFAVTVTTSGANANKVVTINPTSDLDDGVVYVAVSNAFYDAQGNQGAATNASFTIDTTAPTLASATVDGDTLVATFSENLDTSKKAAESAFIVDVAGRPHDTHVLHYSLSGKTATMTLSKAVEKGETVTLRYTQPPGAATKIADLAGNVMASIPSGSEVSVTNNPAPTVSFKLGTVRRNVALTSTVISKDASGLIILRFSKAVYADTAATAFTNDTVDDIITLKKTGVGGDDIAFAAGVTPASNPLANIQFVVDPTSDLDDGVVYVAVSNDYYDAQGNEGTATNVSFTIDTTAPTLDSATVIGTTLTATFSENLDTSKKAAGSAFTVDVAGSNSDPTVSAYTLSGKTATMTLSKAVKQGETLTLSYTQPSGAATKIADVAGNALASIPSGSEVSVTNNTDDTAPTLDSAKVIGNTLTATFSENLDTSKKAAGSAFTVDVAGTNADPTVSAYTLSGKTATMTLSKAVKQGETLTLSYTQPSGAATKIADVAGNALASIPSGSEVSVTNNTDNTAPTVAFAPANGARSNAKSADIVLTFSEPVYANNTATAFTADTVDDIITLNKTGVGGDAIGFAVTVTTSGANANKVVTINPSSDLDDGVVYVAASNAFYDAQGNQGAATNASFTIDTTPPTISSASVNGTALTVTFSENIDTSKKAAESAFTVDVSGSNDDPTVSSYTLAGKTATMTLSKAVKQGETVTLRYTQPSGKATKIVDVAGNALATIPSGSAVSVTNNTDTTAPTVTFKLGNTALTGAVFSNDSDGNISLIFSEPVYADASTTALTSDNVDDIITLKKTGADGDAIAFDATVATNTLNTNAIRLITVNPTNNLEDGVVYLAISNAFYDARGNQGAATNATFTVDTTAPTLASATVIGTTLTATFSEDLDTSKKAVESAFTVNVSGTNDDPTVSSYTLSGKTATMTLSKAVKQGETVKLTLHPARGRRCEDRRPGGQRDGVDSVGFGGERHQQHRRHRADRGVLAGERGAQQRQVRRHRADLQRAGVRGYLRHGVHLGHRRRHHRPEQDRRGRYRHLLHRQRDHHRRQRQQGRHHQPQERPRRRRGVRGRLQHLLRRPGQPGRGHERLVHHRHHAANAGLGDGHRRHPDRHLQREPGHIQEGGRERLHRGRLRDQRRPDGVLVHAGGQDRDHDPEQGRQAGRVADPDLHPAVGRRCEDRRPGRQRDGVDPVRLGGERHQQHRQHRADRDVLAGERGAHQRQVRRHRAHLQRAGVRGRLRHGVHRRHRGRHHHPEEDRRQRRRHQLRRHGDHQRRQRQQGRHRQSLQRPRRRRGVRGRLQHLLRRPRQPGRGHERDVHHRHRAANDQHGVGQRHGADGDVQRESRHLQEGGRERLHRERLRDQRRPDRVLVLPVGQDRDHDPEQGRQAGRDREADLHPARGQRHQDRRPGGQRDGVDPVGLGGERHRQHRADGGVRAEVQVGHHRSHRRVDDPPRHRRHRADVRRAGVRQQHRHRVHFGHDRRHHHPEQDRRQRRRHRLRRHRDHHRRQRQQGRHHRPHERPRRRRGVRGRLQRLLRRPGQPGRGHERLVHRRHHRADAPLGGGGRRHADGHLQREPRHIGEGGRERLHRERRRHQQRPDRVLGPTACTRTPSGRSWSRRRPR